MRGVQRHSVGDSAHRATALRTARLILTPLSPLDEAEHARASGNSDDALRDTRAAGLQWREHGFGPWAIRDLGDNSFLGAAELRFAGDGIEGIAPYEVEAGWWVRENRRNQRIATEAMRVAIGDLWSRAGVESVTAYIEEGENWTVASSRGQPRLHDAQPGPRSLRRTDDGVRASSRCLGSTRRLKAAERNHSAGPAFRNVSRAGLGLRALLAGGGSRGGSAAKREVRHRTARLARWRSTAGAHRAASGLQGQA